MVVLPSKQRIGRFVSLTSGNAILFVSESAWSFDDERRCSVGLLDDVNSTSQLLGTTPPAAVNI